MRRKKIEKILSCVILFIFVLPYVNSMSMSNPRFPLAVIPVTIVEGVFPTAFLQVIVVLAVILSSCGFAGVLAFSLAESIRPISFIPVPILPAHDTISMCGFIFPLSIIHQPPILIISAVFKNTSSLWNLAGVYVSSVAAFFIPNPCLHHRHLVSQAYWQARCYRS